MAVVLLMTSGLLLGVIAWQDFRERNVSVWLLVSLGVMEILQGYLQYRLNLVMWQAIINFVITFSLLSLVWVYYIVKNHKWMNIFKKGFGTADLVLLLILGMTLSPVVFVLFMLTGFILALASTILIIQVHSSRGDTIPLAGYLSIWAIILMGLSIVFSKYPLRTDDWWMNLLSGVL